MMRLSLRRYPERPATWSRPKSNCTACRCTSPTQPASAPPRDAVELEGIRRTRRELGTADHALVVVDVAADDGLDELLAELPEGLPCTIVRNKVDLTGEPAGRIPADPARNERRYGAVRPPWP